MDTRTLYPILYRDHIILVIFGFHLHTVISANRQYAIARRLSNARIRT